MKPTHIITEIDFENKSMKIVPIPEEPKHDDDDHELIFLCEVLLIAAIFGLIIGAIIKFLP